MYVYLITDGEHIKIGQSGNPEQRLRDLQTGSPKPLQLIACIPDSEVQEKKLHKRFRKFRTVGEWFELKGELENYLAWARGQFPYYSAAHDDEIYADKEISSLFDRLGIDRGEGVPDNFRLEQNSNGYYRLRYQLKDTNGEPITEIRKSGRVSYKRGSAYVPVSLVDEVKEIFEL